MGRSSKAEKILRWSAVEEARALARVMAAQRDVGAQRAALDALRDDDLELEEGAPPVSAAWVQIALSAREAAEGARRRAEAALDRSIDALERERQAHRDHQRRTHSASAALQRIEAAHARVRDAMEVRFLDGVAHRRHRSSKR